MKLSKRSAIGLGAAICVAGGLVVWFTTRPGKPASAAVMQSKALDASLPISDREKAILELGQGGSESVPRVREILTKSTEPQITAAAVSSLAQLRDWESMPALL